MSTSSVLNVPVDTDRVAVGIMAHFLDVAAKRGAFSLEESGKIMDALKYLRGPMPQQQQQEQEQQQQQAMADKGSEVAAPSPALAPAKPSLA